MCVCVTKLIKAYSLGWGEWRGQTFFGHMRLLCPSCSQIPQARLHLGGGRLSLSDGGGICIGGGRAGVLGALEPGLGTSGSGQVMLLSPGEARHNRLSDFIVDDLC